MYFFSQLSSIMAQLLLVVSRLVKRFYDHERESFLIRENSLDILQLDVIAGLSVAISGAADSIWLRLKPPRSRSLSC
jgi:hypothetical protein